MAAAAAPGSPQPPPIADDTALTTAVPSVDRATESAYFQFVQKPVFLLDTGLGFSARIEQPLMSHCPERFFSSIAHLLKFGPKALVEHMFLLKRIEGTHVALWFTKRLVLMRRHNTLHVMLRQDWKFRNLLLGPTADRSLDRTRCDLSAVASVYTGRPLSDYVLARLEQVGIDAVTDVLRLSLGRYVHPWAMVLPLYDLRCVDDKHHVDALLFACHNANSEMPALTVSTAQHEIPITGAAPLHCQPSVMLLAKQMYTLRNESRAALDRVRTTHSEGTYQEALRQRIDLADSMLQLLRRNYEAGGGQWFNDRVFEPSDVPSEPAIVVGSTQWDECWQHIIDSTTAPPPLEKELPAAVTEKRKQTVVGSLTAEDIELNCALELSLIDSKRTKPNGDLSPAAAAAVGSIDDDTAECDPDDLLLEFCTDSYQSDGDDEEHSD